MCETILGIFYEKSSDPSCVLIIIIKYVIYEYIWGMHRHCIAVIVVNIIF